METPVAKRGWVKNAAIIFLVILLALTFFSNTIMNATLPEVTTAGVNSGTISPQIRVQGVITANETYEVKLNQTLKVETVFVKAGVTVVKDDPLFTLSGDVSEELKAAEAAVEAAENAYQDAVLAVDGYWLSDALLEIERQKEEIVSLGEKKRKAEQDAAVNNNKESQAEIDALQKALNEAKLALSDAIRNTTREQGRYDEKYAEYAEKNSGFIADKAKYDALSKDVKDATLKLRDLSRETEVIKAAMPSAPASSGRDPNTIQSEMSAARIAHDTANTAMQAAQAQMDAAQNILSNPEAPQLDQSNALALMTAAQKAYSSASAEWATAAKTLQTLSEEYSKVSTYTKDKATYDAAKVKLDAAVKKEQDATYAETDAKSALSDAFPKGEPTGPAEPDDSALEAVKLAQEKAQDNVDNAQYKLDHPTSSGGTGGAPDLSSWDDQIRAAEQKLENLEIALDKKQADKTESVKLQRLLKARDKAKTALEELTTEGAISEFTAPVDGLVKSVTVTPGNDTKPGDVAVSIEMPDRGYYLSSKVSNEQAQLLTPGMEAENENNWWGPSIRAVLGVVRPDPENPRTSKELIFDITGETVDSGSSLSLAIGGRGNQYNLVVPKSAVRSDNNGDFVLLLTEKQTPLGSRYVATRVEVQVSESDDNNSAISGALRQYQDFVITASTSDVSPGQYVRLSGS
ncbi:MAG: HlyD family efflux transporter periplasmic adaptor subunit [Oscillospiraceae bacterium]|jgi:multidrug efflux pump subunit AcrA (membrane-fusion protein)|nr:HlyD family efflux transporter periplasmic adaptor subunit [Oscillospiraceae bacterium]